MAYFAMPKFKRGKVKCIDIDIEAFSFSTFKLFDSSDTFYRKV